MKDIVTAPMALKHLSDIIAVERAVFTTPWTSEMFRQEVDGMFGSRSIVALHGSRLAGYRIAWFIDREVHLVNIAVAPSYQRRGIGALLLSSLIEDALQDEMAFITLEVRESNAKAQEFYHRFLFRTIGVRKGYYSNNREDALLMALDLRDVKPGRDIGEGSSSR